MWIAGLGIRLQMPFFLKYSILPTLGLFPKTHVKIQELFLSGLVAQCTKNKALLSIHYLVFQCHFDVLNEKMVTLWQITQTSKT